MAAGFEREVACFGFRADALAHFGAGPGAHERICGGTARTGNMVFGVVACRSSYWTFGCPVNMGLAGGSLGTVRSVGAGMASGSWGAGRKAQVRTYGLEGRYRARRYVSACSCK